MNPSRATESSSFSAISRFFLIFDKSLFFTRYKQKCDELIILNFHLHLACIPGLGETRKSRSGESERFILAIVQGDLFISFHGVALLVTKDMLEKL